MPLLETDLDRIAAQARQQRDDYKAFGYYIDITWEREGRTDAALDALVDTIAADVRDQIDCTACANCCRAIPVGLVPDDIPVLVAGLGLPPDHVTAQVVDFRTDARQGEWGVFRHSPCAFLCGTRCTVYPHRPASCRATLP